MLYTVTELSDLIGLSKVSIYNKLKLKKLHDHITKKQGITYVDEQGLNLIKDSLKFKENDLNSFKNIDNDVSKDNDISIDSEDLSVKNDYINYLKAENNNLWNELQEKNLQLNNMQKLIVNGQVLLREKPHQDIKALEEHFTELDNKLLEIREHMKDKQKKGFLNKIFKQD